ncbi:MAG TPA: sulfatase, partial [Polyangiaceae bacterium]
MKRGLAYVVALLALLSLAFTARHYGGAADGVAPTPHPEAAAGAKDAGAANAASARAELVLDLVSALDGARTDVPNLSKGAMLLSPHWRKMRVPWTTLSPNAQKLATSIALRTSDEEVQWVVPTASGTWSPDARVWNMSEGSFDQRESIFAPTPATFAYHLKVPVDAFLTFAPGTANGSGDSTVFTVTVADAHGQEKTLFEKKYLPEDTRGWAADERVDLAAYAGQDVELRLLTRAEPRGEVQPVSKRRRSASKDAGGPPAEALGATGLTLALWGNPAVRAKQAPKLPYNVLFIVVDALRPDAIPSFHDDARDAKKRDAKLSPLEAMVPKVPGLLPNLDALGARGVRFVNAYSNGAWTRPGTLSMMSGARSTELGIDTLPWVLPDAMTDRYYSEDPPLLPLLLRRAGATTRAFVNNYFMVGYAPVVVDMGFERVDDHRYRTKDTGAITADAIHWMKDNADSRFFLFCNYNSPHEPWEPPARFLDRVPPPPVGPRDEVIRRYLAEAAKDDEAIGLLLATLDDLKLRENTLVIVTADHGETFSSAHAGTSKLEHMPIRYHHAVSNFEETSHVPILLSLPGVLPENRDIVARIRNTDLAPTILDLFGLEKNGKMSGTSLLPLIRGDAEEERVVLTEGRGTRGLIAGKYRAIFREGNAQTTFIGDKSITVAEELYDLDDDPGERHNLARELPDVLAEMRARLDAAKRNTPVAGTTAAVATQVPKDGPGEVPLVRLRFVGRGA